MAKRQTLENETEKKITGINNYQLTSDFFLKESEKMDDPNNVLLMF